MRKTLAVVLVLLGVFAGAYALSWRVELAVSAGDETRTLLWGVDPAASDGYDHGIDENFPILPPSGLYAYFAIDDPYNPYVTMLSEDVRGDELVEHVWRGTAGGAVDPITVSWNPLAIPLGSAEIGIGTATVPPIEWIDMTTSSSVVITAGQYFWIRFTPAASGADSPPYVVSTDPADGAADVPTTASIEIILADDETGIDPSSVLLTVNGEDVTARASFVRMGNEFGIYYAPESGFPPSSTVEVSVSAAEISTSPESLSYSFSFSTGAELAEVLWEQWITVYDVSPSGDTTAIGLSFGVDSLCTGGFDPGYDVPLPIPPGGSFYAYFPISDPDYPFISMLKRDIRGVGGEDVWIVRTGNPGVYEFVEWDPYTLPEGVELEVGVAFPPESPSEWVNMRDVERIEVSPGQWVWLRRVVAPVVDTLPPYLVSSVPSVGATGVALSTSITVIIADDGCGVDTSSVVFVVDGEDVTSDAEMTVVGDLVYITYDPPTDFPSLYTVSWSVEVSDLATPPNSALIEGYFTTGYFPTPAWACTLVFDVSPAEGSPYVVNLVFGVDEAGTDGFDVGLDYPVAPPIPGAPAFYFFIEDTLWSQLARDIRSSLDDSIVWVAHCVGVDTTWGRFSVSWNASALPEEGYFFFAVTDMSTPPAEWTPMTSVTSLDIYSDSRLFVLYTSEVYYCLSGVVSLEGEDDYSGTVVSIPSLGISDTTDSDGSYELCGLAAGTYTVLFEHDGYEPQEHTLEIVGDMMFDVTLYPYYYRVDGVVALEGVPSGEWDGTVVRLGDNVTVTDPDGYFVFNNVRSGEYAFSAEHEGFVPFDTVILVDDTTMLYVELAAEVHYGDLVVLVDLEGGGDLSGTGVVLSGTDTAYTDASGAAVFEDLEYGTYELHIFREGYQPGELLVTVDEPVETVSTTLSLLRGTVEVTVDLEGDGDLSGTMVVLDGVDTAYTDASGTAVFSEIVYGEHSLYVWREGYQPQSMDFTVDEPTELISLVLSLKHGVIEGFVMLSTGPTDLSGTIVTLDGEDVAYTDMTGFFRFEDVAYGTHSLHFQHDGFLPKDTSVYLWEPGTLEVSVMLEESLYFNPPRNLTIYSRHHHRVAIRWDPPEPCPATLVGYGVIRSYITPTGGDTIAILPKWATGYIDRDVGEGATDVYWYWVFAIYAEGTSGAAGPRMGWAGDNPDDPDVLVVDFDNGALLADGATADEAQALADLLQDAGYNVDVTSQDEQLVDFENDLLLYQAVFVVTGIRDANNELLSDGSLEVLRDYLGAGGCLYWEGADVAADYSDALGGDWLPMLGVSLADDGRGRGVGNVSELFGDVTFFFNDLDLHYDYRTRSDHYIDELWAEGSAVAVLLSQDTPPPNVSNVRMVAYYGVHPEFTSTWRAVTSSIYLGGIQFSDEVNNRWEVLRGVWNFLTGVDIGPYTGVTEGGKQTLPQELSLSLSPTPFNSALDVSVRLSAQRDVELYVEDLSGRRVSTLFAGRLSAGEHTFRWNAGNAPSGTYLVVLKSGGRCEAQKAVLVR